MEDKETPRTKIVELRDMYSLVEGSLLVDTDSDQPHYVEVDKAQRFCEQYANQMAKSNDTTKLELIKKHCDETIERLDSFWEISHKFQVDGMLVGNQLKVDIARKDKERLEHHKSIITEILKIIDND